MKVGDLATSPVIAVDPQASLRTAAQMMMRHQAGSTVVLEVLRDSPPSEFELPDLQRAVHPSPGWRRR